MRSIIACVALIAFICPAAVTQTEVPPEWAYRWYWNTTETEWGDAITCDPRGNIYVAGRTDTSVNYTDWVTLRLSPQGDSIWLRIYDSQSDGIDEPKFILATDSGYVYVAGEVGRSSLAWRTDVCVVKYDSAGNFIWSYRYNSPASQDDRLDGFGMDKLGNIYACGYSKISTSPDREDLLLIKLLPSGDTAWVRLFLSGNQTFDRLYGVAFDDSNYIYATGGRWNGVNYDLYLMKLAQNGDTVWTRTYNGAGDSTEVPVGIGICDSGYIYIGGYTYNPTIDFLAVKYNSAGNLIWDESFNGSGNSSDNPRSMTVDRFGNVYLFGETSSGGQRDLLAVKFTNTGAVGWDFQYGDPIDDEIAFNSRTTIKVDDLGRLFFGGASYHVSPLLTITRTLTFCLDASGSIIWYGGYIGPGNDFSQIKSVAIDGGSNCYVTGYSDGIYGNWDLFVLKYPPLVQAPGNLAGHVYAGSPPLPFPGERIIVAGADTDTTYSGIDGSYFLGPLTSGLYSVTFSDTGHGDTTVTNVHITPGDTTVLDMYLFGPQPGYLAGHVFYGLPPLPLHGERIIAAGADTDTTLSDIDGYYIIGPLTAGEYNVTFSDTGNGDSTVSGVQIVGGDTTILDMYWNTFSCDYVQGDINGDGNRIGGDVTYGVRYFKGLGLPPPDSCYLDSTSTYLYAAGDVNGNCEFRGSDITRLVAYFKGTAELSYCHFFPPPGRRGLQREYRAILLKQSGLNFRKPS